MLPRFSVLHSSSITACNHAIEKSALRDSLWSLFCEAMGRTVGDWPVRWGDLGSA
jgi:hypothetical protein